MIVLTHIACLIIGAIASYLVLRNNPNAKAKVDAATDKAASTVAKVETKVNTVV